MLSTPRVLPFVSPRPQPCSFASAEESQLLLGPSTVTAQLWEQLRRVAPHFRAALITGEPGTGAEGAARVLYDLSPVTSRGFVIFHATEAEARFRPRAHGTNEGLIFLPEVEKLSPSAQECLLRLLRQRGAQAVRVVAYASKGLRPLLSAGVFSPELAGALGVVKIQLPALRDRADDIPLLANRMMQRAADARGMQAPVLPQALLEAAREYAWPGNLDQLAAVVQWLLEHRDGHELVAEDLALAVEATAGMAAPEPARTRMVKLDTVVHEHIRAVLMACNGNKLRAAEVLGISRSTLYRMLDSQTPAVSLAIAV